jgi:DNA-binding winged helix-turn-helix (wHTH) protein/cytochrome c-type biogenesis protein CcmH/NrfG
MMSIDDSRRVLHFDAFALDLSRCTLRRDTQEVRLRPKSFEVLKYLAERPNQIVSKEEVFTTIWPTVSVTDDSLVQCIKEIRQALGEQGRHLLKTLPRRGYLLDARPIQKSADAGPDDESEYAPRLPKNAIGVISKSPSWVPGLRVTIRKLWRHPALTAAAAIALIAATGTIFQVRQLPTNATAAHYAIVGTELVSKRTANDNREAFTLFNSALALDPDNVMALVGYARVLVNDLTEGWAPPQERAMRLDQAEAALQHALKIDADHPGAHRVMGYLWRVRGQPERAIAELEQSLRLVPNNAWARSELGRNRLEAGDSEGAIREVEIAMLLSPHEPAIYIWYFQAGMAAVHAGDGNTALNWFQKSEDASTAYHHLNVIWRAVAMADLGREDEARALIAGNLSPAITVASWRRNFVDGSALVASQRARIADVLLRIGVPSQ